jgi:DNA-binding MarR family transcriptional regulator
MSLLSRFREGLAARLRRFFPVLPIVALAFLMVMPPVAAVNAAEAEVQDMEASEGVPLLPEDVIEDTEWASSPMVLAPLYLRIPQPQLLNSSMRESIYTHVNENPGATFSQIRASVGAATGTVQHHLRVLVRGGILRRVRTGKYTRYYPYNHRVLAMGPSQERLIRSLVTEGPGTKAQIAQRTGMSRQLVHYHVERMASEGLVVVDRDGIAPLVSLGSPGSYIP